MGLKTCEIFPVQVIYTESLLEIKAKVIICSPEYCPCKVYLYSMKDSFVTVNSI